MATLSIRDIPEATMNLVDSVVDIELHYVKFLFSNRVEEVYDKNHLYIATTNLVDNVVNTMNQKF